MPPSAIRHFNHRGL